MRTFRLLILFLLGGLFMANAQEALSAYKYVIVPTKFEGFKRQNQYQTSTLIKYFLVERGFNAVYEDALPADLYANKCLGIKAVLVDESGTFTTKAHISFQDCQLQEVYRTKTGSSKIKDYKGAFQEAISEAMESLNAYTYSYSPKAGEETVTVSFQDDVKELKPEANPQDEEAEANRVPEPPEPEVVAAIPQKETVETQPESVVQEDKAPEIPEPASSVEVEEDNTWYAQEIPNGFQLVDKTPRVRLRLYHTHQEGVFLAEGESLNGIVYKVGDTWYLDHYQEGELVHKALQLKF